MGHVFSAYKMSQGVWTLPACLLMPMTPHARPGRAHVRIAMALVHLTAMIRTGVPFLSKVMYGYTYPVHGLDSASAAVTQRAVPCSVRVQVTRARS